MKLTSDGYLDVEWTTRRSEAFFSNVRKTGKKMADALGADFLDNGR